MNLPRKIIVVLWVAFAAFDVLFLLTGRWTPRLPGDVVAEVLIGGGVFAWEWWLCAPERMGASA